MSGFTNKVLDAGFFPVYTPLSWLHDVALPRYAFVLLRIALFVTVRALSQDACECVR